MSIEQWLVTGGSGFIGSHLIRRLIAEGKSVRAIARSDNAAQEIRAAGAEVVRGDLRRVSEWSDALDSATVVVNLAAVHPPEWRPSVYTEVNVTALRDLAEACRTRSLRLVHISSEAAVAMGRPLVGAEESEPLAVTSSSPYARTKAVGETVIAERCTRGLDAVVLRPRFVWGPGDHSLSAVLAAIDAGSFKLIGDGTQMTSTTHVDNLVEAILLAAKRGASGEVYFIADDGDVPFGQQAAAMAHAMGRELPAASVKYGTAECIAHALELIWRLPLFSSPPPMTRTMVWLLGLPGTIDTSKARRELGYRPVVSRSEGLAELAESAQARP